RRRRRRRRSRRWQARRKLERSQPAPARRSNRAAGKQSSPRPHGGRGEAPRRRAQAEAAEGSHCGAGGSYGGAGRSPARLSPWSRAGGSASRRCEGRDVACKRPRQPSPMLAVSRNRTRVGRVRSAAWRSPLRERSPRRHTVTQRLTTPHGHTPGTIQSLL
ncbi:unnamed protein product, partial [Lampetra fluviatilis]